MKSFKFGNTSQGLPIIADKFGSQGPVVLILGGVHGDEWEGVVAAKALQSKLIDSFTYNLQLTLVTMFNLDGVIRCQRKNANGIDLNRNLPTQDWTSNVKEERYFPGNEPNSEPENKALVSWLNENKPSLIISLHSWHPLININGRCLEEAQTLSKMTNYQIKDSIGYPTPGCLGTYAGLERDMPTITYEIERNLPASQIIKIHVPAIMETLKVVAAKV